MVSVLLHDIQSDLPFALVNHILDACTYNDASENTQATAWGVKMALMNLQVQAKCKASSILSREKKDNNEEL